MYESNARKRAADEELIEVLIAISVVSNRLEKGLLLRADGYECDFYQKKWKSTTENRTMLSSHR